jgi:hypothetical protein
MEDGLLSAEQFSTATLRRVLEPSWKLLAAALLLALAFVLAAAGRPQDMPTDGVVDYFNVGSHASSETFQSGPGDLQVLPNPLAHRPS